MRRFSRGLGLVALAGCMLAALAAPAFAHVTLRADNAQAGGFAKYTVRVPNESDTGASTTAIEVQLPEGYEEARVQPKPGWSLEVRDGVLMITGGAIGPGQFDEFSFSARNPNQPGELTFPSIQTYDDGTAAKWVGPEDAEEPAPMVAITASTAEGADAAHGATTGAALAPAPSGGGAMPIAIAGLVAGLLGLGLGGAAFSRSRRPAAPAAEQPDRTSTSV